MLRRFLSRASLVVLALILVMAQSPSSAAFADWDEEFSPVPDQPTWAAYYRKTARVRLGPEHRLLNGVSWRLHLDLGTGLALPRITWMPDARSTRTANDLLDRVHGGAMLFSEMARKDLEGLNDSRRSSGLFPLEYDHAVVQTDVALTYATPRLASLVDLGFVVSEGTAAVRIIRGLTLDLQTRRIFRVEACPGSEVAYGAGRWDHENYLFQFGTLLQVCDPESYGKFVELVKAKAALVAERTAGSQDPIAQTCSEKAGPFIGLNQGIALYLTFKGVAVHNTEYFPNSNRSYCTLQRSPVNPVILPYRELAPFMMPGAWRDELLKLP